MRNFETKAVKEPRTMARITHRKSPSMETTRKVGADASIPAAVRVTGLAKAYGDHAVLSGVNLEVPAGSVTAMIGPSGAGKSTVLRCMNLLEHPDAGRIAIGRHLIDIGAGILPPDLAKLRRSAGMVFQSFNLFPHMTVLKNVSLPQQRV